MHEASRNLPTSNALVLDTGKIISGVVGTLVVGGILGSIGTWALGQSNSYRINTHAEAIVKLDKEKVDEDVYQADTKRLEGKIDMLLKNFHLEYNEE